ncbi:MAG: guanine deaminase [Halieaceae bacterium]|jgi:guanine deaminase|nr:guanine deaminase [Halieaceae bacterium]
MGATHETSGNGRYRAHRSALIHCLDDPSDVGVSASHEYFEDGLLLIDAAGHVVSVGNAGDMLPTLPPDTELITHTHSLICPGFIDTHIHYPQTGMIASYGEQLLEWLTNYTFPAEQDFEDIEHAREVADVFLTELLRNGTTTALVFGTVHPESVDAFFEAANALQLRMIAGKVLMDRNAPPSLNDTPESGYADSKALIERWHGVDRLHYALTPRFAVTSSEEQLALTGKLLREYPDLYLHTHLSENMQEVAWVKELFPERSHYLDVYDHYGLVGERAVFAHGVHLCDAECRRLAESGAAVAFCPSSNLFLGSGLFDLKKMEAYKVRVGLGTDVGAGTSFSLLEVISDAYKSQQLLKRSLNPFKSLYLATLGGAKALYLDDSIGNFAAGKEADFLVLDYQATPLMGYRMARAKSIEERLFVLMTLGDDRVVRQTFALGEPVFTR